jgi:hypothetical protein
MDKKPNVFPQREQPQNNLTDAERIANFEQEKAMATHEIYENAKSSDELSYSHKNAVEMMMQRTREQIQRKNQQGMVVEPQLAEDAPKKVDANQDLIRKRDEQLRLNQQQTQNYQKMYEQSYNNVNNNNNMEQQNRVPNTPPPTPPSVPPVNNTYENYGQNPNNIDPYIYELSQPNYNAPFDVIPLPSRGKLYRSKKANIKIAYMTTADENILSSPNLLQSGQFLEILINRKILEPEIRYKDLTIGDRNAIMLWLRATAYGEMYPVTLLDELDEPFETEINLNELKEIELTAEPDENGEFTFELPVTKNIIKFKVLTCGDVDELERILEKEKENKVLVNNASTYKLERQIVEINGNRDKRYIKDFASSMRIADAKAFNEYVESIESGIDLNINVQTPGGGSIATFLPLSVTFFWPNIRL